jgi:hypothetical protein
MAGVSQTKQRLTKVAGMLLSDSMAEAQTALTMLRKTTQDAGITAGDFKERFAAVFEKADTADKLLLTREELADLIMRAINNSTASDEAYTRLKRQRDAAIHNVRLTIGAFIFVLLDAWGLQSDGSNYLWLGMIVTVWLIFFRHR